MKPRLFMAVVVGIAAALASCGTTDSGGGTSKSSAPASAKDPLKVVLLYANDATNPWDASFEKSRQAVQSEMGDRVQTSFKANVPETPQAAQVIESAIRGGAKVIISDSYGHGNFMIAAAKKHPDVYFLQSQWVPPKGVPNFSGFDNAPEDGFMISGMAAGAVAKNMGNNEIGYVDAFLIPYDMRQLNGFALGVRKTNPKATIRVILTNSWSDASKTLAASNSLLAAGVGVLANPLADSGSANAAEQKGVPWTGAAQDVSSYGPKTFVSAPVWDWSSMIKPAVERAAAGTWKSQYLYVGIKNGAVKMSPFGPPYDKLTPQQKQQIKQAQDDLSSGVTSVFEGPLKDKDGKEVVADGKTPTVEDLESMSWIAPGVVGAKVPKS